MLYYSLNAKHRALFKHYIKVTIMKNSQQIEVILYTLMAIGHFLLGALHVDNGLILITQTIGACFWLYMACNLLQVKAA